MNNLLSWSKRPTEVANLLNPAYFAVLINKVCDGYQSEVKEGLPYALAFITLPIVMYPDSAEILPKTSRTRFQLWLQQNPEVLFNFAKRAKMLAPYIREGISFGVSHNVIRLTEGGNIIPQPLKGLKKWEDAPIQRTTAKQAHLIGKIFGHVNDVPTLFATLGVRP